MRLSSVLLLSSLLMDYGERESTPEPTSPTGPATELTLVVDGDCVLAHAAASALNGKSLSSSNIDGMPIADPRSSTEYKIRTAKPDPGVKYTILQAPNDTWDDVPLVDP